MTSSEVGRF